MIQRPHRIAQGLMGFALLALLISFGAQPALAGPAARVTKSFTQPDKTVLELTLWGDEFAHGWETTDGQTVLQNQETGFWEYAVLDATGNLSASGLIAGRDIAPVTAHLRPSEEAMREAYLAHGITDPKEPRLKAAAPWASGTTNVLVIMVQFPADAGDPDGAQLAVNASFSAAQMQANLFGGTPTGPGNMTDYYDEISFGALDLQGTVVGPFTVANDKDDYDDGPLSAGALVAEAIALADPSVDFTPFDNDGNGEVDMVAIAYAGNGPDNGGYNGATGAVDNLWPHASSIGSVNVDGGARSVSQYFIAAELLNSSPRLRTIGVYAHELGHKIGLPDLYDTDQSSEGIGHWGLMGSGSWCSNNPGSENGESPSHMTAWSKWYMGWITPTDLTGAQVLQNMPQAETNPFAVRLLANPGGPSDWPGSGEYFLIENRQQTGFDIGLDGCGILVWHLDESLSSNSAEGHTAGTHRLIDLEQADGLNELASSGDRGDSGDPFPGSSGNMLWDDTTSPGSLLYDGSTTGILMAMVDASCGDPMAVAFGDQPPVADAGGPYQAECASHSTTAVQLDASGSTDPDGDALSYSWAAPGVVFDDPTAEMPTGEFPMGATVVTLTVSDGILEDTDTSTVTIVDTTPPEVTCPGDITVECTSHMGTPADDPQLAAFFATFAATDVCDADPDILLVYPPVFPLGDTVVTYTATDASGNVGQCSATVTVEDTTPPEITVVLSQNVLWPPNHKMVEIEATVEVTDICDPNPTFVLSSAVSSEPDDDNGDGETTGDIGGADIGTADTVFDLRAERDGRRTGRIYTICFTASDMSGNTADACVEVIVPHDKKGAAALAETGVLEPELGEAVISLVLVSTPSRLVSPDIRISDGVNVLEDRAYAFKAPDIDDMEVYVGNTAGALRPLLTERLDADADGLVDLALHFPEGELQEILASSDELDGPVSLHYVSQGENYLVEDVLALAMEFNLNDARHRDRRDGGIVANEFEPVDQGDASRGSSRTRVTQLTGIYPNPFNPSTTVRFELQRPGPVQVVVYNLQGGVVRTLVNEYYGVGEHSVSWNGMDASGAPVASGTYFVRFVSGDVVSTQKAALIK